MTQSAPAYDSYQESFHAAFREELEAIIDALPIPAGGRILDVPCGNGFYSRRLAQRLNPGDELFAVDSDEEYLERTRIAVAGSRGTVVVLSADAYRLAYESASFDLVWCAQSLISLEPDRAIAEMKRVLKPSGVLAILESDEFHHVLLPWPLELEAAWPQAIHRASEKKFGDSGKLAPARKLRSVLRDCGFGAIRRVTYPFDRAAPFDDATAKFLSEHGAFLTSFAYPHLRAAEQAQFDECLRVDGERSLLHSPDTELICLNAVYFCGAAR